MRHPIAIRLPTPAAASADRLAVSFADLSKDLVKAGMHAPSLAAALRAAAHGLDGTEPPEFDGITLPPMSDPMDDIEVRSFNVGHDANNPKSAVLLITADSARQFGFLLSIADLRIMGEALIKRAGRLARLAMEKEQGK